MPQLTESVSWNLFYRYLQMFAKLIYKIMYIALLAIEEWNLNSSIENYLNKLWHIHIMKSYAVVRIACNCT